jgi:hypothetical protein
MQDLLSVCSVFKIDRFQDEKLKDPLDTHTNEGLDFHVEGYGSRIHAVKRLFARWKHKARVVMCMQCISLYSSGWCRHDVQSLAFHTDGLISVDC